MVSFVDDATAIITNIGTSVGIVSDAVTVGVVLFVGSRYLPAYQFCYLNT